MTQDIAVLKYLQRNTQRMRNKSLALYYYKLLALLWCLGDPLNPILQGAAQATKEACPCTD